LHQTKQQEEKAYVTNVTNKPGPTISHNKVPVLTCYAHFASAYQLIIIMKIN